MTKNISEWLGSTVRYFLLMVMMLMASAENNPATIRKTWFSKTDKKDYRLEDKITNSMVGGKADWLHLALAGLVFAQQTFTRLAFTKPPFTELAFAFRIFSLVGFNTFITYYQFFEKLSSMLTHNPYK